MKLALVKRRLAPKYKRIIVTAAALLFVGLLLFAEVIRPDQDASAYTGRLNAASKPLQRCFEKLAGTTQLSIFYAPDVPIDEKQKDVDTIHRQITACRQQLASFDKTSHQLMSLHLAGYTKTYHDAKVNQRQASDVIGQSSDVLNQYDDLANFLSQYYTHTGTFLKYTDNVSRVDTAYISAADLQTLTDESADLRTRAVQLQKMKTPAGFEGVARDTAAMFTSTADGIDSLLQGYQYGNDYLVTKGYKLIDTAVSSYDGNIVNQPFDRLIKSYVPTQVNQLPGKVENLLAAEVE